jgi:hypothetical protein
MGLLDQIIGRLRGQEPLERLAREEATFDDPKSPDFEHWNQLVGAAPPEAVQDAMTRAAQQVDPQEYYEHITPGVRGTDPLGALGGGALGTLAGRLLGSLAGGDRGDLDRLRQQVPGLHTADPQQMSPQEVASLANYLRQHHPGAFGRAAAQLGREEPGLLQQLLGNKFLLLAAAGLAAKFLGDRTRGRSL